MKKAIVSLLIGVSAVAAAPVVQANDNPWLVRFRAVNLNWDNSPSDSLRNSLSGARLEAVNQFIPEVDISYFFNKNFAAELVLTYPQKVDIDLAGGNIGSAKALPPSLLLQYHFTDFGSFKPYVGVGVNYTLFTDRKVLGGAAKVESSSVGYAAQLGADYMFDKNWGLNIDLKYADIKTDVKLGGNKIGSLDLSPTMFGIGVTYKY
jgi:outer membrane protein